MKPYELIRSRRKELKMTQLELAQLVGYTSRSMVAMIERGKVDLPSSKVKQFAKALNISVYDLMGLDDIYTDTQREIEMSQFAQMTIRYALETSGYFNNVEFTDKEINRIIKYAKLVLEEREDD